MEGGGPGGGSEWAMLWRVKWLGRLCGSAGTHTTLEVTANPGCTLDSVVVGVRVSVPTSQFDVGTDGTCMCGSLLNITILCNFHIM